MLTTGTANEFFEISPRFREVIEQRIERLERDAVEDEAQIVRLSDPEHIRRHMCLVAIERAEAQRMRSFLGRTRLRLQPVAAR